MQSDAITQMNDTALATTMSRIIGKMSPSRRIFVEGLINGKQPAEAYAMTGGKSKAPLQITSKWMKRQDVQLAMALHYEMIARKVSITKDDIIKGLQTAINSAIEAGQFGPVISAYRLLSDILGLVQRNVQVDVGIASMQIVASDDEDFVLLAETKALIARRQRKPIEINANSHE